ncbi:MAG: FHA domain-containing protein [Lachnospiraceae bacterium]|nr:FHA domain-containing protein [Lachnospiraceae bacterium]
MAKFKICPECGKRNPTSMLECLDCEMDLSDVPVTDEDEIKKQPSQADNNTATVKVRVCEECGEKNPVNARKCRQCGEDISDVVPTDDLVASNDETTHYVMASIDGAYTMELTECNSIIGRENMMKEYLSGKAYVSRRHAELIVEEGKLFLKDCGATNHSYVNNEMVPQNSTKELHDGDIIGFGGNEINGKRQEQAAYFVVRIGSCI